MDQAVLIARSLYREFISFLLQRAISYRYAIDPAHGAQPTSFLPRGCLSIETSFLHNPHPPFSFHCSLCASSTASESRLYQSTFHHVPRLLWPEVRGLQDLCGYGWSACSRQESHCWKRYVISREHTVMRVFAPVQIVFTGSCISVLISMISHAISGLGRHSRQSVQRR